MTTETAGTTSRDTLRDTLADNFDKLKIDGEPPVATPAETPVTTEAVTEAKPEGRTAGRQRDEKGKLLPGKADKPDPVEAAPVRERPKYPSTWKKDYEPKWATIDHDIAEEISRREGDYAKGVSTYKGEYDRLKPFGDAITPYMQLWQQAGIQPHEAVKNLAETDRILRSGSKDEKLRLMAFLAKSYEVPMHEMLVQGEDGKIYFNQQYAQPAAQQQPQGITPEQVKQMIEQSTARATWLQQVKDFKEAKDGGGNPRYPHVKEVEETMAGLLRAGLAQDLNGAYEAALRHPKHTELFDAMQKQQAEAKAQADAKAKAEAAAKARRDTVSTKSQSPTGVVVAGATTRKGLRESLSEGVDAILSKG